MRSFSSETSRSSLQSLRAAISSPVMLPAPSWCMTIWRVTAITPQCYSHPRRRQSHPWGRGGESSSPVSHHLQGSWRTKCSLIFFKVIKLTLTHVGHTSTSSWAHTPHSSEKHWNIHFKRTDSFLASSELSSVLATEKYEDFEPNWAPSSLWLATRERLETQSDNVRTILTLRRLTRIQSFRR